MTEHKQSSTLQRMQVKQWIHILTRTSQGRKKKGVSCQSRYLYFTRFPFFLCNTLWAHLHPLHMFFRPHSSVMSELVLRGLYLGQVLLRGGERGEISIQPFLFPSLSPPAWPTTHLSSAVLRYLLRYQNSVFCFLQNFESFSAGFKGTCTREGLFYLMTKWAYCSFIFNKAFTQPTSFC